MVGSDALKWFLTNSMILLDSFQLTRSSSAFFSYPYSMLGLNNAWATRLMFILLPL